MGKKYLTATAAIIIAIVSILFFFIPNSLELFSFSGIKFLSGELWRLLTFSFTHISGSHLKENLIALGVVALLAKEFGFPSKLFMALFLITSILVALLEATIFPTLIIAGASLGIYGVLGSLSMKGTPAISSRWLIIILGLSVFVKYAIDAFTCHSCAQDQLLTQSWFHFFGFVAGIAIFYPIKKKKIHILTGEDHD